MTSAQLVEPLTAETLEILGPTIQFLVPPEDGVPCVMLGTIPPGGAVPLHSHEDPETFLMLSGEVDGLTDGEWTRIGAGEVFHVPGNVKHAWRNPLGVAAVMYLISTATIGRFFREVAANPDEFLDIASRYGYWNATPEENAALGVQITASGASLVSDAVPGHATNEGPGA
jgi:quercetin dioxygenase-like cupin family protein